MWYEHDKRKEGLSETNRWELETGKCEDEDEWTKWRMEEVSDSCEYLYVCIYVASQAQNPISNFIIHV